MVKAYIELYGEETGSGRRPKGDPDISVLKPENCTAILHNQEGGRIVSTIFKVDIPSPEVDRIVGSHPNHSRFDTDEDVQWRGLEIQPGTPTDAEVDGLQRRLQKQIGMDISRTGPPRESPKGASWVDYLKSHTKSIGQGYWLCEHSDHGVSERVQIDEECSLGHDTDTLDPSDYTVNRRVFDVTRW